LDAHYAIPGLIWKLPRMLLDPQHPLSLRWRDLDGAHRWGLVRRLILPPRGFSHRDQGGRN
jgi:hypothetical protein